VTPEDQIHRKAMSTYLDAARRERERNPEATNRQVDKAAKGARDEYLADANGRRIDPKKGK
jgi:hypothetical protein